MSDTLNDGGSSRTQRFEAHATRLGVAFQEEIRAIPKYEVAVEHGGQLYISGQIPRVDGQVAVTGRVGSHTSLIDAQQSARICVVRALAIARQSLGALDRIARVLRMTGYVQCDADFTLHSEAADAASEILYEVLAPLGGHTRTSVGVFQLPKNASTEIDLVLAIAD